MAGTEISGTRTRGQATASIATRLENVTPEQALETLRTVANKLDQNGKTLVLTGISDSRKTLVFKRWNDASEYRRKQTAKAIEILLDRAAQGVSEHRKRNLQSALKSYLDRSSTGPRDRRHLVEKGIGDLVTALERAKQQQAESTANARNVNPGAPAAAAVDDPANPQPQVPVPAPHAPGATQAPSAQHLAQVLGGELMALRNADPLEPTHPLRANRRELLGQLNLALSSNPGWISNRLGTIRDRLRLEAEANPAAQAADLYDESVKVLAKELYAEATLIAGLGLILPDGKPDSRLPPNQWRSLQLTLLDLQVSSGNPDRNRLDQSLEFLRANAESLKPVLPDDAATFALIRYLVQSDVAIGQVPARSVMLGAQLAPVMQAAHYRERSLLASGSERPARSAASQFVTGAGGVVARMLLNEQGALDLNVVRDLKHALETNPLPRELAAAPVPWYSRVLGNLAADAELVRTLESIQAPKDQTSPAASIIRTTLGLPDGETVSALHARQAVLSAMFTPLRQGAVGSCFATSVAIRLQQLQPSQMVQDMAQLISSGELVFTRPDGSIKRLLLSETASTSALSEPISLPASDQARAALQADPGLRAALLAVGIGGNDIKRLVGEAIDAIAAKPRAQGADVSTSAAEIIDEVLLARHGIPRPDLDEHKKVPQLIQDVLRCQLELESLRAAPSRPNTPIQINAKEAEIDALMDRRQAIADLASASLMPQFLHERDLAASAWQGTEDNRILRAWEYTLSARAESNVSDRFMKPLSRSISALAANELRLGKLVVDGTLIRQVETELERLINERFDYAYDASMRSTLAADGSSTEGGFVLVDNGRPGSGDQPTRIDGAETFQMMMAALSAQALQNVAAQLPQSVDRGTLQAAGQQLIRAWFASKPAAAGAQTLVDNVTTGVNLLRRQSNENIDAALPWALPDGYDSIPVLRLRAGAASNVVSTRMPKPAKGATHSPEDVASFLIDEARKLPQPIADAIDADREHFSLPMGTKSHAFLLKPGLEGQGIQDSKGSLGIGKARGVSGDSRAWLRDAIKPSCDALGEQAIPDQDVSRWLERIGQAVSDTPELDRLALGDPNSQGFSDWKARMVSQAGTPATWKGLRQAVADEFRTELTAGEFQFTMLNSLPPAARGPREAELKRGIEERLRAVMQPIDARMVLALNPPVVMLADLNWGSATEPGHLAVTYNPASGESEFWRCNDAQGTRLISPLYGDAWVSNVSLITAPAVLGVAASGN